MGRNPSCLKKGLNKGSWTAPEDQILRDYVKHNGEGKWSKIPKETGLKRSGKSCRLRWLNYLSPDIKRGNISPEEEDLIIRLHKLLGNRWALIARRLPGRTDNEIKNYWNTSLRKKQQTDHSSKQDHLERQVPTSNEADALFSKAASSAIVTKTEQTLCDKLLQTFSNVDLGKKKEEEHFDSVVTLWDVVGQISLSEFLETDFAKLSENNFASLAEDCNHQYPNLYDLVAQEFES